MFSFYKIQLTSCARGDTLLYLDFFELNKGEAIRTRMRIELKRLFAVAYEWNQTIHRRMPMALFSSACK